EVPAGCEYRVHAGNRRDLTRLLRTAYRLDHFDEDDVVVDRIAITARYSAPEVGRKCRSATLAPFADWREIRPVSARLALFNRSDGRDHNHQSSGVHRMLDLALIGKGHTHTRNGLGVW